LQLLVLHLLLFASDRLGRPRDLAGRAGRLGIPSSAASSMTMTPSPVLPLPVMPMQTACVTRSFDS
jgi:hypothetical protein